MEPEPTRNAKPELNLPDLIEVQEGELLSASLSASDPDGNSVVFSSSHLPKGASLSSDGYFEWTPDYDQSGTYVVPIQVSDSESTVSGNLTVSVENTNRSPVIEPIAPVSVDEGAPLSFQIEASDPDNDVISFGASSLPVGATFDPILGTFEWTPNFLSAGEYEVSFQASDDESTTNRSVPISVRQVNHWPPVLFPVGDLSVNENETLSFRLTAEDEEGASLTFTSSDLPPGASLDPLAGDFTWTPSYRQAGSYTITFGVSDGLFSDEVISHIQVNNILTDLDDDGFREDLECNDDDAATRPLEEYEVTAIISDTTICPGIYRGVNVLIGEDEVSLNGTGVTLEHAESVPYEAAIGIAGHHGVTVSGFTVQNYPVGVQMSSAHDSVLDELTLLDLEAAIRLEDSHDNTLSNVTTNSYVSLRDSTGNVLSNLNIDSSHITLYGAPNTEISGCTFSGEDFTRIALHEGSNDASIHDNTIRGGTGYGGLSYGALTVWAGVGSSRAVIENNLVEDNFTAIHFLTGTDHVVRGNTVINNTGYGVEIAGGGVSRVLIEDNVITDNWSGIDVGTRNNTIRNNDLRRNTNGNHLNCGANICENNLE